MFKKLEAYFKTENDAEDVHAKLNSKVNIRNVMIDQVPDGSENTFVVPIITGGGGSSGAMSGNSAIPVPSSGEGFLKEDEGERKTFLECEVLEEDFNEALMILKENDAYVNKDSLE